MRRDISSHLDAWLVEDRRRPLVVRGARQVGKTWLVRDLARRRSLDLVECNFERTPGLARCFESNDPLRVLGELGLTLGHEVVVGESLLFLDEIQAAASVLPRLRWFAEELPALAVVAAGSLIELVLADHDLSMPVGRVTYLHVEPMSFREFLLAHDRGLLLEALTSWRPSEPLGRAAHQQGSEWFARYLAVGGMPAVVGADVEAEQPRSVRRLQHDLVATWRDDFPKYAGRMSPALLDAVLVSAAAQLGRKFVYSHVSEGVRHDAARRALELLSRARLCHIVAHTAGNGIPLGGEIHPRNRKVVLLDVGLAQALLGMPAGPVHPFWERIASGVRGALVEQAIGQQLRSAHEPWEEPRLFYWQRGGGRPGEIDYVTQVGGHVVPVEVKSGAAGSLKSLHQFVHDKGLGFAVRIDANPPGVAEMDVRTTQADPVRYRLLSLPHFLAWRLHEIASELV